MEELLNTARRARKGIIPDGTDAYRLFDGEADGRPDVFVDNYAGRWLVSHRGKRPSDVLESSLRRRAVWFKRLDQDDKSSPTCGQGDPTESKFVASERGVQFQIDFSAGYSQGLFLDQRQNRYDVARRSVGQRVLNCFSYTCGFSVAAAVAGAESTTSLDLSRPYLDWGKENFALNGIDLGSSEHYFCRGEAFEWLGQFAKRRREFNGVVLDPPSFSRSKQGGVFSVEKDYARLAESAARVVGRGGWLLACTNHRGLGGRKFREMVRDGVLSAGRRITNIELRPMPPDFTGEQYLKSVWVDL